MTDTDAEIQPGGPMTAEKLRSIAAWYDVYDAICRSYIDLCVQVGLGQHSELLAAFEVVNNSDIQDDLRRWADELDARDGATRPPGEQFVNGIRTTPINVATEW